MGHDSVTMHDRVLVLGHRCYTINPNASVKFQMDIMSGCGDTS